MCVGVECLQYSVSLPIDARAPIALWVLDLLTRKLMWRAHGGEWRLHSDDVHFLKIKTKFVILLVCVLRVVCVQVNASGEGIDRSRQGVTPASLQLLEGLRTFSNRDLDHIFAQGIPMLVHIA